MYTTGFIDYDEYLNLIIVHLKHVKCISTITEILPVLLMRDR